MIEDNIIIEGSMSLVEVNGEHVEGHSNENVQMVYANKQIGPCRLPRDMKNFFPRIDGIKWIHGSLSTIDADDLNFPDLNLLDLQDNKLISLPSDLFRNSHKLQWIQLDFNKISHVGRNFFDDLKEIGTIRFRSNPCMNVSAETPEEIEDLKLQLPISCPSSPTPLRCTINDEVSELWLGAKTQEKTISEMFEVVAENQKKTDEVKVQMENQLEENIKNNADIEELKQRVSNQNKTIAILDETIAEMQKETERLESEIIGPINESIVDLQTRLEKVENLIKYCQCSP